MVQNKEVLLEKVDRVENIANFLTKSISTKNITWCRSGMGLIALSLNGDFSVS